MTDSCARCWRGKKALVFGIANEDSIAYGCAKAFRLLGADLAVSWLNEKARRFVEPLAQELEASITGAVDVEVPRQLEAMFEQIRTRWGRLDILVHSIAFAPKEDLQGGLLDCSAEGFAKAMDISCHSFVRMAKLAAPLMTDGGAMFAMSYYGANRVVPNYNVMGPVKAALEAACRYLAYELGPQEIRVHAISPGPLKTRAASGLKDFELMLNEAAHKAPLGELVDIMDVGYTCAYLATPFARRVTGGLVYVDGGANLIVLTERDYAMSNSIAVINAGSSSVKFAIYQATKDERCLFRGQVEGIGVTPQLKVADDSGRRGRGADLRRARLRPRRGHARDHRDRARVARRRVGCRLRSSRGPRRPRVRQRPCA